MATIEFYNKDVGVSLTFTIVYGGSAVNLSGFTTDLILKGTKSLPLTIISAASGVVGLTTSAAAFPGIGEYDCQIVRSATGVKVYTSNFLIKIKKAFNVT